MDNTNTNNDKRILVFEPNDFHGEVVAGIVQYLCLLGYGVDAYVREKNFDELKEVDFGDSVNLKKYDDSAIPIIFSKPFAERYDFVFFTSMEYKNREGKIIRFADEMTDPISTKYGLLGIYHTTS